MTYRKTRLALSLFVTLLVVLSLLPNAPALVAVPTAQAATGDPLFKPPLYVTADNLMNTFSVAVGDLDSDGALDIVFGNSGQPSQVYLNDGHGSFTPTAVPLNPNGNTTQSVALGDLNGDEALDLVLGNNNQPSQVYLNDGHGKFTPTATPINPSGNTTQSVALGDLNGDEALDLVLGNSGQPSQVYLNDGHGNFTLTATPINSTGNRTSSVAVGDLNGDGSLDLVLGNGYHDGTGINESSQVYLNDGHGSFTPTAIPINPSGNNTWSVAVGDFNGDGILDLVLGNYGPSQVYLNDGHGSFTPTAAPLKPDIIANDTNSVALGDLNGDGRLDIVIGFGGYRYLFPRSQVYLNDGHGNFTPTAASLNPEANNSNSVAVGDLNGDGTLDILFGNSDLQSQVYLNDGYNSFTPTAAPINLTENFTLSVAVGDLNGDGALDIVLGNGHNYITGINEPSQVYLNDGHGGFTPTAAPLNSTGNNTSSVALGDLNGDGSLDLVLGNGHNFNEPSQVYLNDGHGRFTPTATPINSTGNNTWSVALGDLNGDEALDLVLGNNNQPSQVYLNDGHGKFTPTATPINPSGNTTQSVALGDLNGDEALDLVLGNSGQPSQVYLNDGHGSFTPTATPINPKGNNTWSVAVGDFNGDGILDLVLGNADIGKPSRVYLNDGHGSFTPTVAPINPKGNSTQSVAMGDLNGDGALDLVLGNHGQPSQVYLNDGYGNFTPTVAPLNSYGFFTVSVALGDMNGDGTLDVVLGNKYSSYNRPSHVYLNHIATSARLPNNPPTVAVTRPGRIPNAGFYSTSEIIGSPVITIPYRLTDYEGDPVRAVQAQYSLDGGGSWKPAPPAAGTPITNLATLPERFPTYPVPSAPIPDVGPITSTLNIAPPANGTIGTITNVEVELTITHTLVSDLSASLTAPDGTVVPLFASGVGGGGANISGLILSDQAATPIISATAPISGTFRPTGSLATLNGKNPLGQWTLTVSDGVTLNTGSLVGWALRLKTTGVQHVFPWDTFASGIFGQSDNVVVRLVAYPSTGPNSTPVFQHSFASSTTFPFRVRGTQVRVVDPQNVGQPNAVVFRLNDTLAHDQQLFAPSANAPAYTTNASGYLGGRGELALGNQLIALAPISLPGAFTNAYSPTVRLYATNIITTPTGISGLTVAQSGVQTVTVSLNHPLALFDIMVSLEWDARYDARFMLQLQADLARASELLFQASHGQAALGNVTIFHDRENWDQADIRIYASNRVRPSAMIGGVVGQEVTDPVTQTVVLYDPGQVRMGAVWNRFGSASGNLSEDWPRTLVHELGHYLFFLEDNYVGLKDGQITAVSSCPGLMGDSYAATWQYQTSASWSPNCNLTFSNQTTGRADWATIQTFYPALVPPTLPLSTLPSGPLRLPLSLTEISSVDPLTPTARLDVPIFYMVDITGERVLPALTARAYLFQHDHSSPDTTYTQLVPLGRATNDQVLARGARVGDRLCLFEPTRFGCETIQAGNERLTLTNTPAWHPDIQITPVTSKTLEVTVSGVPTGTVGLRADLYPLDDDPLPTPVTLNTAGGGVYSGTFTLAYALRGAYIHLQTTDGPTPIWETVTSFALDGNAGVNNRMGGSGRVNNRMGGSGRVNNRMGGSGRVNNRVGGSGAAFSRTGGAPVSSAEGDVLLDGGNLSFALGQFLLLQTTSSLPPLPPWATLIGQGYRFTTSPAPNAPNLTGSALSFSYLDSEVPVGEESGIQVYYRSPAATAWTAITTTLDTTFNMASIPTQGSGLYAVMSSLVGQLGPSWSMIGYPSQVARQVPNALTSIDGTYRAVYHYNAGRPADPWELYSPSGPAWLNTPGLCLRFGEGYWVASTSTTTTTLRFRSTLDTGEVTGCAATPAALAEAPATQSLGAAGPPATYYGVVTSSAGFTAAAGQVVVARVGSAVCGQGVTQVVDNQVVYRVHVNGATADTPECGLPGRTVSLEVAGAAARSAAWGNATLHVLDITPATTVWTYLPLVRR